MVLVEDPEGMTWEDSYLHKVSQCLVMSFEGLKRIF